MYRIFRHYIPKSLFILGLAEVLILLVSVYLGVTLTLVDGHGASAPVGIEGGAAVLLLKALVYTLVMFVVMMAMGLYQRDLRDGPRETLLRLAISFGLGLMLMAAIYALMPQLFLGRGVFFLALACAFLGIVSCRFLAYQRTDMRLTHNILVLGAGEKASQIQRLRRRTDRLGVNIVGYVDVVGSGPMVLPQDQLLKVSSSLQQLAEEKQIDEIIVALDDRRKNIPIDEILECKLKGIRILEVSDYLERQLGKINLDALNPSNVVFSDGFSQAAVRAGSKRLFDILVSSLFLIAASPVMLLAAFCIWAESGYKGSVIYRQQRVGMNGRPFDVLKFRSMCENAEKDGVQWAKVNDDRVTRIGAFMRKTRIDELPQLLNVLQGDMSFVGPRPERPVFVGELEQEIPFYGLRHHVKPGITGWAQICYPYGSSVNDAREKLQYDLYYMKNYSVFLDITILLQTATVILWGKGAR